MKKRKKRITAVLMVIVLLISMVPQIEWLESKAASAKVTLSNLGKVGTVTVGNKTKSGNWWKMNISKKDAFCMDLGYTCHSGDVYQSESDTYSSSSTGKNGKKACIGYWFDETQEQSNKAYIMAQALFWAVEEGADSENALKKVIKKVKENTGYYSGKTAAELYQQIFDKSKTVTVKVTKWKYSGSGTHRQELLVVDAGKGMVNKPKCISATEYYRQRITLEKRDEDGKLLPKVTFTLSAKNIDELYSFYANGWGEAESSNVEQDIDCFELTKQTNTNGRICYRFTYRIQSQDYYYYTDEELANMESEQKKKAKKELDNKGYKYAPDLSYTGAKERMQLDIERQLDEIKNVYVIKENEAENKNISLNTEYVAGKTIELGGMNSWRKNDKNEWPDVADGTYSNYALAYSFHVVNKYKKATLLVGKKDGYSADGKAHGDADLEGATFKIYQNVACTQLAPLFDSNGNSVSNREYTIQKGKLETDYLRCGPTYYLKETKIPQGYQDKTTIIPFTLDGANLTNEYSKIGANVIVENPPILGKVAIQKYYSEGKTGKLMPEPGAIFEVYLKSKGSYEKCDDYERDKITTDINGYAQTKDLYYGTYVVHQVSNGGLDTELVKDFEVQVKEHGKTYHFPLNDVLFSAYLRIIKKSANTKKTVLKAGTTYQIYRMNEKTGEEKLVTQSVSDGNKIIQKDCFQTDENGVIMTHKPLVSGVYRIYEVESASGFHITTPYVQVNINSKEANYKREVDAEGNVHMTVEVNYFNEETKGKLYISKMGEQLAGYDESEGKFVYEKKPLKGAVFEIYAAEDIVTQDNQGTVRYKKGEFVQSIETDNDIVSVDLPLGKYEVREVDTKYGYVLEEQKRWYVEFTWEDKEKEYVLDSSEETDEKGVLRIENQRAKPRIELEKKDDTGKKGISGVVFGLFTKDDIYNSEGEKIVEKDTKLTEVTTDEKGQATVNLDVPLMSKDYEKNLEGMNSGDYYVKELEVSKSYYLDGESMPVHLEYKDKDTAVVLRKIEKNNTQTEVMVHKYSLTGSQEIPGCRLRITDKKGNIIVSWVSADRTSVELTKKREELGYKNLKAAVDAQGGLQIGGLFYGEEYTLTETKPADGFVTAENIKFVLSEDKEKKNNVVMRDDTTKVEFRKINASTKKQISGAGIAVYDSKGQKVCAFITEKEKVQRIEGILRVGETYTFKEEKVPAGYAVAEDMTLTIQNTGAVQIVEMEDEPTVTIKENKIPQNMREENKKTKKTIPSEKVPLTGDNKTPGVYVIAMIVSLLLASFIGKVKGKMKTYKE